MALIVDLLLIFVILIISGGLFTSMYFNYKQFQDFTKFKEKSKKQDSNLQILFKKVNENDKYLKDQTDKQQKVIDKNKSQMASLSESIKPILKNEKDSKSDSKSDGSDVKKNIDSNSVKNNVSNKMFKDFGLNTTSDKTDTDKTTTSDKTDTDKTKKDTKDSNEAFSPILSKVMNSEEILNNLKNIIYSY